MSNPLLNQQQQSTELWESVINKKTNEPYKNIQQCNDLERLAKEEPEMVKEFGAALTEFLNADPKNIEVLKDFYKGFKKTIGEYEYKMIQFKDGARQISRYKRTSGYSRGGTKSYQLLRTVMVKTGKIEEVQKVLDGQGKNDNWEIQHMRESPEGDVFLMLNKSPYVPTMDTANGDSTAKEEDDKEETTE